MLDLLIKRYEQEDAQRASFYSALKNQRFVSTRMTDKLSTKDFFSQLSNTLTHGTSDETVLQAL